MTINSNVKKIDNLLQQELLLKQEVHAWTGCLAWTGGPALTGGPAWTENSGILQNNLHLILQVHLILQKWQNAAPVDHWWEYSDHVALFNYNISAAPSHAPLTSQVSTLQQVELLRYQRRLMCRDDKWLLLPCLKPRETLFNIMQWIILIIEVQGCFRISNICVQKPSHQAVKCQVALKLCATIDVTVEVEVS